MLFGLRFVGGEDQVEYCICALLCFDDLGHCCDEKSFAQGWLCVLSCFLSDASNIFFLFVGEYCSPWVLLIFFCIVSRMK